VAAQPHQPLQLAVIPVSGGRFPIQLAAIRYLCRLKWKPELVLAGSGGAVASYVASAANWNATGVTRIAASLDSHLYVESWFSPSFNMIHSGLAGAFYGAIYKASDKAIRFFNSYFTPSSIMNTEIWVGAVNYTTGAVGLFTNRNSDNALIKGIHFNRHMFKCEKLHYLSGDLYNIMSATLASASIPLMVKPRKVCGQRYIDCGTKMASPLVPLQGEVEHLSGAGVHIFYFNGFNVEEDTADVEVSPEFDLVSGTTLVTSHLVRGFMLNDRMAAYNMISKRGLARRKPLVFSITKIEYILTHLKKATSSLVEFFPVGSATVLDLTSFQGEDVVAAIDDGCEHLAIRVWWCGEPSLFDDVTCHPTYDTSVEA